MRIAIDAQATVGRQTGLGTYTRNLLQAIKEMGSKDHQFFFYQEPAAEMNTLKRLYWENMRIPHLLRRDKIKLLHVPAFAPSLCKNTKTVVTVHDLIGMLFPNNLGKASRFYWGKWLPAMIQKADKIIADSEHTRKDILSHLNVSPDKVEVVYPSGHEGFKLIEDGNKILKVKAKHGIRDPYFLAVGTLEPRKNLKRIILAFAEFNKCVIPAKAGIHGSPIKTFGDDKQIDVPFQLVIVGSKDFAHGKIFQELVKASKVDSSQIIFTGYLDVSDLNTLYSGATAFLFPSLYEGFGIPVLEAMASGAPVIASNTTSVPEVAGDAAILIQPEDTHALTEAMTEIARNPKKGEELRQRGFKQIQKFSWKKMAARILEIYESLQ